MGTTGLCRTEFNHDQCIQEGRLWCGNHELIFSRVFLLAAVMYVDDTDLLHWAEIPETTDEELIEKVQWELDVWADIVNATGGRR